MMSLINKLNWHKRTRISGRSGMGPDQCQFTYFSEKLICNAQLGKIRTICDLQKKMTF